MRPLSNSEILLLRVLRDYCLFLKRSQIERILGLAPRAANKKLPELVNEGYLASRHRLDTYRNFQTPLYYLGRRGWDLCGGAPTEYKDYESRRRNRKESSIPHLLAVYDVLLKFVLESQVVRWIAGEDPFWFEAIDFGNVPDGFVQFRQENRTYEAFLEVDLDSERPAVLGAKIDKYHNFNQSGRFKSNFRGCAFTVLFVVQTDRQAEKILERAPSDDFWVTTRQEFVSQPLFGEHWLARDGVYSLRNEKPKQAETSAAELADRTRARRLAEQEELERQIAAQQQRERERQATDMLRVRRRFFFGAGAALTASIMTLGLMVALVKVSYQAYGMIAGLISANMDTLVSFILIAFVVWGIFFH